MCLLCGGVHVLTLWRSACAYSVVECMCLLCGGVHVWDGAVQGQLRALTFVGLQEAHARAHVSVPGSLFACPRERARAVHWRLVLQPCSGKRSAGAPACSCMACVSFVMAGYNRWCPDLLRFRYSRPARCARCPVMLLSLRSRLNPEI